MPCCEFCHPESPYSSIPFTPLPDVPKIRHIRALKLALEEELKPWGLDQWRYRWRFLVEKSPAAAPHAFVGSSAVGRIRDGAAELQAADTDLRACLERITKVTYFSIVAADLETEIRRIIQTWREKGQKRGSSAQGDAVSCQNLTLTIECAEMLGMSRANGMGQHLQTFRPDSHQ